MRVCVFLLIALQINLISCEKQHDTSELELELSDLDELINFSEQKLNIMQKLREKLFSKDEGANLSETQKQNTVRKVIRKELKKIFKKREEFSTLKPSINTKTSRSVLKNLC